MFYTLNTGFITSVCSLTAVIMLAVLPETFLMITFEFLMVKLYVNSYLAMLNARNSLRRPGYDEPDDISLQPCNMTMSNPAGGVKGRTWGPNSGATVMIGNGPRAGGNNSLAAKVGLRPHVHSDVNFSHEEAGLTRHKSIGGLLAISQAGTGLRSYYAADTGPDLNEVWRPTLDRPSPARTSQRTSIRLFDQGHDIP